MSRKRKPTVDSAYDRRFRNDPGPESRDLSMDEVTIFEAARNAVTLLKKTFETWTVIGKAVVAARTRADRVGGGKTFRRILEQQGLAMVVPPATATRLEAIMAHLADVEAWRAGLTDNQRFRWAAPSAVFKHCPMFAKDRTKLRPAMKPRRPSKMNLEAAIDTIVDGAAELAMDERMAILTRIANGLGIATEPKKIRRRKAKSPFQQAEDNINRALGGLMGSDE
jgi:hypothetical protein